MVKICMFLMLVESFSSLRESQAAAVCHEPMFKGLEVFSCSGKSFALYSCNSNLSSI
ncbi:hypothetical protein M758_6G102200 [Ceratodon purpureus]|uniref:Uncharacterized protein n=1 Tax=Ceratodon purpureus TaxID=3225 RepID=A0A8T0HIP9_CERPU|nr:hypothetical protein KC19_6G105900 [Ceratodon purpureus]KAG0613428.1 hypothetical protein M758_6G102200 [Ceratodon purpureus]